MNFAVSPIRSQSTQASAYLCQYQCQIDSGCVRFSFHKSTLICYLGGLSTGTTYVDTAYISGPKYCQGIYPYKNQLKKI